MGDASPRHASGYSQALWPWLGEDSQPRFCSHREGGRHSQAEQSRLLPAQPSTELPEGLLASLSQQGLCHRPIIMSACSLSR